MKNSGLLKPEDSMDHHDGMKMVKHYSGLKMHSLVDHCVFVRIIFRIKRVIFSVFVNQIAQYSMAVPNDVPIIIQSRNGMLRIQLQRKFSKTIWGLRKNSDTQEGGFIHVSLVGDDTCIGSLESFWSQF